jgi:hypothetical protein
MELFGLCKCAAQHFGGMNKEIQKSGQETKSVFVKHVSNMIFKCGFSNFPSILFQVQQAMLKKNHWPAEQQCSGFRLSAWKWSTILSQLLHLLQVQIGIKFAHFIKC